MKEGKVKIKRMGLPEGDPEKEGVLVHLEQLVPEMQRRLAEMAAQIFFLCKFGAFEYSIAGGVGLSKKTWWVGRWTVQISML